MNINNKVEFRLTEHGKEICRKEKAEYLILDQKEFGYATCPFWEMMMIFGPHIACGKKQPFENGSLNIFGVSSNGKDDSELYSICDEAKEITGNDRMEQYGHPKDNFKDIASLWSSYAENNMRKCDKEGRIRMPLFQQRDVALMMILLKVAREQARHKRDNLVDIAGYARNIAQIEGEEN